MNIKFTVVGVIILTVVWSNARCFASSIAYQDSTRDSKHMSKTRFQLSMGIANTNLLYSPAGYQNQHLYFAHADIFLVKKVSPRSNIRIGIAYEPVGFKSETQISDSISYTTKYRLFYGNVHLGYSYKLFAISPNNEFRLLVDMFGGRIISDDILSFVEPGHILYRNRAMSSYSAWNTGFSVGALSSISITKKNSTGIKIVYNIGTSNSYSQEATIQTGIKQYTRSVTLSVFLNL